MLLLKVTKAITGDKKNAKNGPKQYNKLFFCPKGKKSLDRRPKLSAGARSKPAKRAVPSSGIQNCFSKRSWSKNINCNKSA